MPPSRVLRPPQPPWQSAAAPRASALTTTASAPSLVYSIFARTPDNVSTLPTNIAVELITPLPPPLPPILPTEADGDFDGDGVVSAEEFLVHRLDTDGDGIVSGQEISIHKQEHAPAPATSVAAEIARRARKSQEGSRWAMPLPSGRTMQEIVIDESRRRAGRPPRAAMQAHLIDLQVVLGSLVHSHKAEAALKACKTFATLTKIQLAMICQGGVPVTAKRYAVLYRAGARPSCFYILLRGSVQFDQDNVPSSTIHVPAHGEDAGICFGLESLSSGVARPCTARINEACDLLQIKTPSGVNLDNTGVATLAKNVFCDGVETALSRTPLFMDLPPEKLKKVAPLFKFSMVAPETTVFLEGDPPDAMYILLNGSVDLVKDDYHIASLDGATTIVGEGHPFFGAASVLEGGACRPWDAYARTPCQLLVLPIRKLKPFLRSVPDFREHLAMYATNRRKKWEFEAGRPLPVGKKQRQEAIEEAAVIIQGESRASLARKSYKALRDKELMTRGIRNIQGGKALKFVDALKTNQIRVSQNAALGITPEGVAVR